MPPKRKLSKKSEPETSEISPPKKSKEEPTDPESLARKGGPSKANEEKNETAPKRRGNQAKEPADNDHGEKPSKKAQRKPAKEQTPDSEAPEDKPKKAQRKPAKESTPDSEALGDKPKRAQRKPAKEQTLDPEAPGDKVNKGKGKAKNSEPEQKTDVEPKNTDKVGKPKKGRGRNKLPEAGEQSKTDSENGNVNKDKDKDKIEPTSGSGLKNGTVEHVTGDMEVEEELPKKRGRRPAKKEAEVKEKVTPKKPSGRPKKEKPPNDEDDGNKAASHSELLNETLTKWRSLQFGTERVSAEGNVQNFTLTSWNVDGLRAWVKKDGHSIFQHAKPDIICLQEIKCSEDKLPNEIKNIEGYHSYWCVGKKEGYAGVGYFSKIKPIDVKFGIDDEAQDDEGRCITAEYNDYYVVGVYVPNAGRKLVTLPKRLEWNKSFADYIKELNDKKPVIICGDMNVAHSEIDLANPKANTKNAGFTKEERDGMTEFLSKGYVDVFRKLYPDQKDTYTFWTYMAKARARNVGWRLDYFIVSERFMDKVCDVVIHDKVFGSDHCPLSLYLSL